MLKHLPKGALKTIEKTLHCKEAVYHNNVNIERRNHNGAGLTATAMNATQIATLKKNDAKELNIDDRISKFKEMLKNEHVYRIPLRYLQILVRSISQQKSTTELDYILRKK